MIDSTINEFRYLAGSFREGWTGKHHLSIWLVLTEEVVAVVKRGGAFNVLFTIFAVIFMLFMGLLMGLVAGLIGFIVGLVLSSFIAFGFYLIAWKLFTPAPKKDTFAKKALFLVPRSQIKQVSRCEGATPGIVIAVQDGAVGTIYLSRGQPEQVLAYLA